MDWLRADEVSVLLNRSVRAIYRLGDNHRWPKAKAGKHTFYSSDAIFDYLEGKK